MLYVELPVMRRLVGADADQPPSDVGGGRLPVASEAKANTSTRTNAAVARLRPDMVSPPVAVAGVVRHYADRPGSDSATVDREVHVVLGAVRPIAAPAPADRAERRDHGRRDHPFPQVRAVEERPATRIANAPAAHVRVLDRVEVDRVAVGVVRPVAAARPAGARGRDRLAAVEGARDVRLVGVAAARVHVLELHVPDGEVQLVEAAEDAREWLGDVVADDELPRRRLAVPGPVRDRQQPKVPELDGATGPPIARRQLGAERLRQAADGVAVLLRAGLRGLPGEEGDGEDGDR